MEALKMRMLVNLTPDGKSVQLDVPWPQVSPMLHQCQGSQHLKGQKIFQCDIAFSAEPALI